MVRVPAYISTIISAAADEGPDEMMTIDPFPIIGFYLYHVISADQSNNWTTSGIWSCNNLLLILHAFHNG